MTAAQRMAAYVAAFGQQGARAASIYTDPAVMKNLLGLTQGLRTAPTPEALRAQYANSPKVQFDRAIQDFNKAMTQLGEAIMPEVTTAIKAFSYVLKGIAAFFSLPEWLGAKAASGVNWLAGNSPGIPATGGQTLVVQHQTNLDGRVIANAGSSGRFRQGAGSTIDLGLVELPLSVLSANADQNLGWCSASLVAWLRSPQVLAPSRRVRLPPCHSRPPTHYLRMLSYRRCGRRNSIPDRIIEIGQGGRDRLLTILAGFTPVHHLAVKLGHALAVLQKP